MIALRPVRFSLSLLASALVLAGCASAPRAPVELNIVALNDFHGNLEPSTFTRKHADGTSEKISAGGVEVLSGALSAWRGEDKDLLLVAAGDLVGASPALSSMWADEPSIEAMNMLGLNTSSLGNHEFDAGRAELLRRQNGGCESSRPEKACQLAHRFDGAHFAYLAANVTDSATGKPLMPGWRVVDVKGVKVGLVGAVLEGTPSVAMANAIAGLRFASEAESINKAVPQMRAAGAQVFIALIHEGGSTINPPDQPGCENLKGPIVNIVRHLDPAIRLVVTGHSHTGYLCNVDGRVVTQADAAGHLLTRVKMTVDPSTGAVRSIDARNLVLKPGDYAPDPKVTAFLAQVKERSREELARPIAKLGVHVVSRKPNEAGESPVGDLIADAILAKMRDQAVQIGFMNPGGIRKDLEANADTTTTYGQAQAVLPFGNTLVAMDLTGAQLYALLEHQWARPQAAEHMVLQVSNGFTYRWDDKRPKGSRVIPGSVKLGGVPIDESKTYRVVANNFLAEGGDNFPEFAKGTRRVETPIRDLDALIEYLGKTPNAGVPTASLVSGARIERVR